MTLTPKHQSHNKIKQLINSSRFNEAFALIKKSISQLGNLQDEKQKLSNLETTYKYLLKFMAEGLEDDSRPQVIDNIRENLLRLNDIVLINSLLVDNPDSYSSVKRMENLKDSSFHSRYQEFINTYNEDNKDRSENDNERLSEAQINALVSLFNYVWTMLGNPNQNYEEMMGVITDKSTPITARWAIINALTLAATDYFDSEAFSGLLDAYDSQPEPEILARIMVAIALISYLYPDRIRQNLNLNSRLLLMREDSEFNRILKDFYTDFVRTYDTKRVTTKMREEVIPGLMKINPDIIEKMRNMASDSEDFLSESNPEWEEMIESSGIQDKIQEINDMQMEGSDVMMTTFSNLKGFPFFNNIANWFLPFLPQHPDFKDLYDSGSSEDLSRLKLAMCDSDIYSFILSLKNIPESHRKEMLKNMQNQMKQAQEMLTSAVGDYDEKKLQREIRHSLQDLYRFFNLYRKKSDFNNPFENPATGLQIKNTSELLGLPQDLMKNIADFYFKHGYYALAADMFENIESIDPSDFGIWEKIGYCHDRCFDYSKAAEWYKKAEIVNPGSPWLEKKLAICLKNAGRFKEAIDYYEKVLENEPENYHLLMSAGQCWLDACEYEKALLNFHHADYIKPQKKDAKRAIAWTRLMAHDFEKAKENFAGLTQDSLADKTDFLNAALCDMATGDIKGAINHYTSYFKTLGNVDFRALMTSLRDDANVLKHLGIPSSIVRLVVDKLRYDLL